MPFTIIRGDITRVRADAVVNAANSSLLGGGGVDGAIHRAAGEKLLEECRTLGGCETGRAKITKGYDMPCKYIIHTVGPIWRGGNCNEEALLYSCYKSSLELAVRHNCASVAFPLISAGAYGYPKKQALDVATRAIAEFLEDNETEITLVVFDGESVKLSGSLADEIKSYIDDVYVQERYPDMFMRQRAVMAAVPEQAHPAKREKRPFTVSGMKKKTFRRTEAEECADTAAADLDERLRELDLSFSQKLMLLIDESGRKDSEVYKAANVSKQAFSKIRSDKNYHPKKITVFAFAIALRLSISGTEELLRSAGYALTRSDKSDIIIGYFIERGIYKVYEINEVLFDYDLPLMGG